MTLLAPTLEAFFTQHMAGHREASPRTIGSYRDTWRLFLGYAREKTGTAPAGLDIAALDAGLVSGFLTHLEQDRGNTARTRNARLAALRSFFKFAALRHPRARRDYCPGPRDPREETRLHVRLLPHRRRDQGPARRSGHRNVARPPRPRPLGPRRPDRAALLRAHRPDPRRCPDRNRADRALPRKGPQGPRDPAHREYRRGNPHLAPRAARRPRRPAVPDHYGPAAVFGRRPGPSQAACRNRRGRLPVHSGQKRHSAHPETPRGHGPPAYGGRSRHHRSMDGSLFRSPKAVSGCLFSA